jgi:hypothetical protein
MKYLGSIHIDLPGIHIGLPGIHIDLAGLDIERKLELNSRWVRNKPFDRPEARDRLLTRIKTLPALKSRSLRADA